MTHAPDIFPPDDPYAPKPSWAERNPALAWGGGVFLLTALLTYVAFPPVDIGEAAYLMLVPAVLWAYRAPRFKFYARVVLAAQIVAWTGLLGWLHNVTWFGLFVIGPLMGLLNGAWFLAVWWVMPRLRGHAILPRVVALLALAGLWVVAEWVRGWIFGGLPWLPLAASQWHRPLVLQLAAYGGAWAVSFVLVFFNLGVAAFAHRLMFEPTASKRSPEFFVALATLVLTTFPFLGEMLGQQRHKLARIALVQPYIPQGEKWDPDRARDVLRTIDEVTQAAAADNPDLIVWPEAVVPWALHRDPNVQPWLESMARRTGRPILLGSVYTEMAGAPEEKWFNGAFVVDPHTGLQSPGYAKRKLVPFGEYVPFRSIIGWVEKFVPIGGDFRPGDDARPLVLTAAGHRVPTGILICYEDIFPHLARASVQQGAELLAVLTNNAWFGEGGAAYQHATHSVLRAVENRRPLIRVGNGGWSGWIDEYGNIRASLTGAGGNVYYRGHQTVEVTRDLRWHARLSVYTQRGDWFLILSVLLTTFGYYLVRSLRPPSGEAATERPS